MRAAPECPPKRGSVDAWVTAPAAGSARYFLHLGEVGVTSSTAVISLGINTANYVTALMRDKSGSTVVNILADAIAALPASRASHIVFSWDADLGTASLTVNGQATPAGDYTVNPSGTSWSPGVPLEASLDKSGWAGSIHLVQLSSQVL